MKVPGNLRENTFFRTNRRRMKAPAAQTPLEDLKKNVPSAKSFQQYVRTLLNDSRRIAPQDMGSVLDIISINEPVDKMTKVTGWSTVFVSNCEGVSNESILLALKWVITPLPVEVFDFKRSGEEDGRGQFLVDSILFANRLKRLREDLAVLYSCKRIRLQVMTGLPITVMKQTITPELIIALKLTLYAQYDGAKRRLDLERFHANEEMEAHIYPLHSPKLLEFVLELICRELPSVAILSVKDNYLCSLSAFGRLANQFPKLVYLDLSANRIKDLAELNSLSKWSIQTLNLSDNMVANADFKRIQAILPNIKRIEGIKPNPTPRPSKVTKETVPNLPLSNRLQSKETNGLPFCYNFSNCYYNSFEGPELRKNLGEYYEDEAEFSLSVSEQLKQYYAYKLYDRNIQCNIVHSHLQFRAANVIKALCRLPRMQTNRSEASVNVLCFTGQSRIFTLEGNFMELTETGWETRQYQRKFTLRPSGSGGWLIHRDSLSINLPNAQLELRALKMEKPDLTPIVEEIPDDDFNDNTPVCIEDTNLYAGYDGPNALDEAIEQINSSMPNMALEAKNTTNPERFNAEQMPPLVPIVQLASQQESYTLEQEIDNTLLSDEENCALIIDEDVLLGEDEDL